MKIPPFFLHLPLFSVFILMEEVSPDKMEILGFGALNFDFFLRVERTIVEGEIHARKMGGFPGGSAANTIYALGLLGVRAGFAGAIGDDEEGREIIREFQKVGVDTRGIRIKRGRTGRALCFVDKAGRRAIYVLPEANSLFEEEDFPFDLLEEIKILHLSSFIGERQFEIQKKLLKLLPPHVKLSFSPGGIYAAKGLGELRPFLKRSSVLFLNQTELMELAGSGPPEGVLRLLEEGCEIAVVTLRRRDFSCCLGFEGKAEFIPRRKPLLEGEVDTTGAGDAFAAGFLYMFMRGEHPRRGCLLGEALARLCVERIGARTGLARRKVEAALEDIEKGEGSD